MKRLLFAAFMANAVIPSVALSDELSEDRIKELVYEAIRENPGIVMEAVAILERQQEQAAQNAAMRVLRDQRGLLENDPNATVLGNPDGDVTVVEFLDYNCAFCRRVMPEVEEMIASDPNVRVVYREWPILGDGSVFAARAALAARSQGLYEPFHVAMMRLNQPAQETSVLRVAREVGLDVDQLLIDMEAPEIDEHIRTSMELTRALGFNGTPSFVIGDELVRGYVEAEVLVDQVQTVRSLQN